MSDQERYQPAPELDPRHELAMAAFQKELAQTGPYRDMYTVEPQPDGTPMPPLTYEEFMYPGSSTDLAARQRLARGLFANPVEFGLYPEDVRAKLAGTLQESRVMTQDEISAYEADVERAQAEVRRDLAHKAAAAGEISLGQMIQRSAAADMRTARVGAGSSADGSAAIGALPKRTPIVRAVGNRVPASTTAPIALARRAVVSQPAVSPDTRPVVTDERSERPHRARHARVDVIGRQSSRPDTPRN